jgi:hypothetical protein
MSSVTPRMISVRPNDFVTSRKLNAASVMPLPAVV